MKRPTDDSTLTTDFGATEPYLTPSVPADGAGAPVSAEVLTPRAAAPALATGHDGLPAAEGSDALPPVEIAGTGTRTEIVFIESDVAEYQVLANGVKPGVEVHVLDASGDGLAQMAAILAGRSGVDAVHIVSHGSEGEVELGSLSLTAANLENHRQDLNTIAAALDSDADVLLYGCDVAAGSAGAALIDALARQTGADVAASTDTTGNRAAGGDWLLESATGPVEAVSPFQPEIIAAYGSILASGTITFTSNPNTSTVTDGMGGSADIPGITIQITNGSSYTWTYETPYTQSGIAASYLGNDPSSLVTIKSTNQSENFWFKSIFIADYGGANVKVEGFDNETSTGSVNLTLSTNGWENTFNSSGALTSSIFNNIDEVRITPQFGTDMWIAINNIQIDDPVIPNTAPTLTDTAVTLSAVNENSSTPSSTVGTLVSSLVSIGGNVTDGDSGAVTGIAVTATDSSNGSWYYSTNDGSNWSAVGTVSNTSALLLRPTDRLYFDPNDNFTGTVASGITFRAWDQTGSTAGQQGSKVSTAGNGGSTPFSSATDTASITVTDVDPVITAGQSFNVAEISGIGTAVGTVAKTGDTNGLTWSITGGTGQGLFNIDTSTGAITSGAIFDYEITTSYTLDIAVDDEDGDTTADSTATVTINVTNVNDAPVANDDTGSATEAGGTANGTAGSGASGNVLSNDSDPDVGDSLLVTAVGTGISEEDGTAGTVGEPLTGTYGTLTLNSDGSYSYTVDDDNLTVEALAAGQSLTDVFNYKVSDGSIPGGAVLRITINGANDAPVIGYLNGDSTPFPAGPGSSEYIDDQPSGGQVAFVLDIDSDDLLGGSLTITQTGGAGAADGTFSSDPANDAAVKFGTTEGGADGSPAAGDNVYVNLHVLSSGVNWVSIGTVDATDDGQNGNDLRIALGTAYATDTALSIFLQFLKYGSATTGTREFTVVVTDGEGDSSPPVTFTMTGIDATAPTLDLANSIPADDSSGIAPSTNIQLAFDEDIAAGTGSITLINVTTGATVETFDIATGSGDNGGTVSISGATLTVNPGSDLAEASQYAIRIDATAIEDGAGNAFAGIADDTTFNFTTGVTDNAAPVLLAIHRDSPATELTNAATLSYTVKFNEAVTGVDAGDFALASTGSATGSITGVSGNGTDTITVTVSGVSGTGSLGLDLAGSPTITDLAGNGLPATGPADDEVFRVDRDAPTLISLNRLDSGDSLTNAGSAQFLAVFSEAVGNVDADDFDLAGTLGSAIGDAGNISVSGSGAVRTITVSNLTGAGSLSLDLNGGATITDGAGNSLANTNPTSGVDESYTRDATAPTAVAITRADAGRTTADSVSFNVTFSEGVQNVDSGDFALTGSATGTIASVTPAGDGAYSVTVTGISGDGSLGLEFAAGQDIADLAGNAFASGTPVTSESYTIDNTAPAVTAINRAGVNQIAVGTPTDAVFTVVFDEPVSGLAAGDFTVTGTAANSGVTAISSADGKVFQVTVGGVDGSVGQTVGLNFTGSVADAVSQTGSTAYTSGQSYTIGGVLLNEGAVDQATLDGLAGVNRDGTLQLVDAAGTAGEVVIIDSRVPGLASLVDGVREGVDVWLLDAGASATAQITGILGQYQNLSAVHLISHGSEGAVYLGAETLSSATLPGYAGTLAGWGNALSATGDFLLYGCDVAQGTDGLAFVNGFAAATGADVAASDDLTGSSWLGGDWILEANSGTVEETAIEPAGFDGVLASSFSMNIATGGADDAKIYVRPTGTSNTWTFSTGWFKFAGFSDEYLQIQTVAINSNTPPPSGSFLQYSTDNGANWSDLSTSYVSAVGSIWRYVNNSGSTSNFDFTFNYTVNSVHVSPGYVGSWLTVIPDDAPTDIAVSYSTGFSEYLFDDTLQGTTLGTLTPTDTGNTKHGVWVVDGQSTANLFSLSSNTAIGNTATLTLGSGTMPAAGQTASVTVHYYDMYQTDASDNPINGSGYSETFNFHVVSETTQDLADFGSDIALNTTTANSQAAPALTQLSNGNFVGAWYSSGQGDGLNSSIIAQVYSPTGTKIGAEIVVSPSGNGADEYYPTVAALDNGRFVVAYFSGADSVAGGDIRFVLVASDGTAGTEQIANTAADHYEDTPSLTVLADGNFMLAWASYASDFSTCDIVAQKFDAADGSPVGSQFTIRAGADISGGGATGYPSLAPLPGGDYVATWTEYDSSWNSIGVYGRVGSGTPFQITADTDASWAKVAVLGSGDFVVVWDHGGDIYFRQYDDSGTALGAAAMANAATAGGQSAPSIVALDGGGFVIAWQSDTGDYSSNGVFGRRFDANGTAIDISDFEINEHRRGDQTSVALTAMGGDGFVAAWQDGSADGTGNSGVEARVLVTPNPSPSVATPSTISYTDTSADDSFSNTTGTLSATDDDGIASYGIQGGTTGGSTSIGGTVYDVSRAGSYGTLYVKSSDGAYVYVPNNPAINNLSADASETFTVTVTDGNASPATGNATLTVNVTGANDAPSALTLDGATTDSLNQSAATAGATVGTLAASDAENGTLNYALVSGTGSTDNGKFAISGSSLTVGGDALAAGSYSVRVQATDDGSPNRSTEQVLTVTVADDVAPALIAASSFPADNATGISVTNDITVTFDENVQLGSSGSIVLYDVTGGGANSVTIDVASHGGQLSVSGATLTINPTADLFTSNQYAVQIGAGAIRDSAGNGFAGISDSTTLNFTTGTVDTVAPTAAIVDVADPAQPNAGTVTINFSEAVQSVDISDFTLTRGGDPVNISGLMVNGSGSQYTLDLSGVTTTEGSYVLTLNTSDIQDTSGNPLAAGDSDSFTVDTTAPAGVAIVRASANPTNAGSVSFTVAFSEAVTGVDSGDFSLAGTAAAGAAIQSVTQVSDGVYSVAVNNVSGDGTLGLNLNGTGTGIADLAGNAIAGGLTGQTYAIDHTAPAATAINRTGAALTNAGTVSFTVSFDQAVTGVDAGDFSLDAGGVSVTNGDADISVTGSGSTYTVTVANVSGDGSLSVDLKASGTGIADGAGNAIAGGFTGGAAYTIDNTDPAVTAGQSFDLPENMAAGFVIGQVQAGDTNGVAGYAIASGNADGYFAIDSDGVITLTAAGAASGAASADYETGSNSFSLGIVASDAAGNASAAETVTIALLDEEEDATPPTVTSIVRQSPTDAATNADSVTFRVTFSEAVQNVGVGDFALSGTAAADGTIAGVTAISASVYDVAVTGLTDSNGSVNLDLASSPSINDPTGNVLTNGTPSGADESYSLDHAAPSISIDATLEGDNRVNASEDGDVVVSGTSSGAEAGQIVTVTLTDSASPTPNTVTKTATVGAAGSWSISATPADISGWTNGSIAVTADVSDLAGNAATQAIATLALDNAAPAIAIATVAGDGRINATEDDGSVIVSGTTTAEDGQTVSVNVGGIAKTATASGGAWSVSLASGEVQGLTEGNIGITADVADLAGNAATQASATVVYDKTAPTLTIAAVAGDDRINADEDDAGITVSGSTTAEDGQTVSVDVGGIAKTAVASGGAWSVTLTGGEVQGLTEGNVAISADVADLAGNAATQATRTVVYDASAPAAPTVPDLASASDSGSASNDDVTNATTPTVTGTAEPNATVTLYDSDGSTVLGTATADGSGNWSITSSTLAEGSHTLTVKATDAAGNESVASSGLTVTVDTTGPAVPGLALASDSGSSSSDGITNLGTINVTGLEAGASWEYNSDGGSTWSAGSGTSFSLAEGSYAAGDIQVRQTDLAGNTGSAGSNAAAITVDTTGPSIAIDTVAGDDRINAAEDDASVTVSGTTTAEDGQTVSINVGGIAKTATASGGTWSVSLTSGEVQGLSEGNIGITADVADLAGNSASQATRTVVYDKTAPVAPVISAVTDDAGVITGPVADGGASDDAQLLISGSAEPNSTVELFDGSTSLGTATADGSGAWSFTTTTLADGPHSFTAFATDAAGNTGPASAAHGVIIDTVAPTATTTIDAVSEDTGSSASDFITNDTSLTVSGSLSGTLDSGDVVNVYDGATLLGAATVNGTGWSFSGSFGAGSHTLKAVVMDPLGTEGTPTLQALTVDTAASAPAIALASDSGSSASDGITNQGTVEVTGLETGASWEYSSDGGSTWSAGSGTSFSLAEGSYAAGDLQVRQTDLAGNISPAAGNTAEITVDSTPPASATGSLSVPENAANGVAAGTVSAGDALAVAYSLIDSAGGRFAIDAASGQVSVADGSLLNFEAAASHSITVRATDAAGNSSDTVLSVTVTDLNEAPQLAAPAAISFSDTAAADSFANAGGQLAATDVDAGTVLQYGASGATGSAATIDGVAYDLTVAGSYGSLHLASAGGAYVYVPDAAAIEGLRADASEQFTVTVSDGAGGTASQVLSVQLAGANDAPAVAQAYADQEFSEALAFGFQLPATGFGDRDQGDGLVYSATLADGSPLPGWLGFDPASRSFSATPQDGDAGSLTLKITATDGGGLSASQEFTLTLSADADRDGIPDHSEGSSANTDTDQDGIPDYLDGDSDNDGIADVEERDLDSDGDGVPNFQEVDDDGDGIDTALEAAVPGVAGSASGDGNGDGVADILQQDVTSLPVRNLATGRTDYLTVANSAGAVQSRFAVAPPPDDVPAGVDLPLGVLSFDLAGVTAGATVAMQVFIDSSIPVNGYWKQDNDGNWHDVATAIVPLEGGKTRIDFELQDNGIYDSDPRDGFIVDPGGPGFLAEVIADDLVLLGDLNRKNLRDQLTADAGNDRLYSGRRADVLQGLDGNDYLDGGPGRDQMEGGNGNDVLWGGGGNDRLLGGDGADKLVGSHGSDLLVGGRGGDIMDGGGGTDTYRYEATGLGSDDLVAGGHDLIRDGAGSRIDFSAGVEAQLTIGGTALSALKGTVAVGDTLDADNSIAYADGQLLLDLNGDGLFNAADDFRIDLISHNDRVVYDAARDLLVLRESGGQDFAGRPLDGEQLQGILLDDRIVLGDEAGRATPDQLSGGSGNDYLYGGRGDDTLQGLAGNDYLDGGAGGDRLEGGSGADVLLGQAGTDQLLGGDGADVLLGKQGADLLIGGAGNDYLFGGAGRDTYRYEAETLGSGDLAAGGLDVVRDGRGSLVDFTAAVEGLLRTGGTLLSAVEGKVRLAETIDADNSIAYRDGDILVDLDGDGLFNAAADFRIELVKAVGKVSYDGNQDVLILG